MAKSAQFGVFDYEDFQPLSEWKEEPENNILVVHLPDFTKEQMRITCVSSSRIVRVTAERQLAKNKWSRCNRAFQIPDNCKVDKIHAKWYDGSLTITMPKETITQPVARKEEAKTTQEVRKAASEPKSPKDHQQQAASPKAADKEAKYRKDQQAAPGKAAASSIIEKQNEVKKDASATATSSIHGEKKTDGKSIDVLSAKKSEKKDKLKKGDHLDESTFPKAASTMTSNMKQTDKGSLVPKAENIDQMRKKERREAIENIATKSKKPEIVTEKTTQVKESAFPKTSAGKEKEKEDKSAGEEKQKEKKSITAAAMKAVKGLAMVQSEDRQLVINIGVAALVLVAIGAYVSYSFRSKSKE